MLENGNWRNRKIRRHVAIVDGKEQPTLLLKNATYLNMFTKTWLKAHIWIDGDRIVYVGDQLPDKNVAEVVDCQGKYLVPGYVEPHAHPYQVYNPEQLALHVGKCGTTTLVNDNLLFQFLLDKKKAFSLLNDFHDIPVSMFWWERFDSQTALLDEETIFNTRNVLEWLSHPAVVQGGELTSWPSLMAGDDRLLYWIQETKQRGKPVEGHFPGASEKTLTKMKLFGVNADHEAMTGAEVIKRLELGYQVGLRYSSIRPDLPKIIDEMLELGLQAFDNLMLTTDGSTPAFYKEGMINQCIDIAIKQGVPIEEAYRMASYNPARHLFLDEKVGSITPGRIAHINILRAKDDPHPESVLAKGQWLKKDDQEQETALSINWERYHIKPLTLDWDLTSEDLQFSGPIGLDMVNDVIMKPYAIDTDITVDELGESCEDAMLLLVDRKGAWRVNTAIRGFTKRLGALASSYSLTGDFVFIGKSKYDILLAWKRMKEIGGGIVIVHQGEILLEIPLQLSGFMDHGNMEQLIDKEMELRKILNQFGYAFGDPIYTIFFLASTHLPYIRITQQGIIDIMKKEVLYPSTMR